MLYHRSIFWDNDFDVICEAFVHQPFILSRHIKTKIKENNFEHLTEDMIIFAINKLRKNFNPPFEIETECGKIVKFVSRIQILNNQDMCVVFAVHDGFNKIKTAYINCHNDNHKTLNCKKYYRGE